MYERVCDVGFEGLDVRGLVDDQLQEEFLDPLEMRPSRVYDDVFFLDTGLSLSQSLAG